jgi:hypothetical protein
MTDDEVRAALRRVRFGGPIGLVVRVLTIGAFLVVFFRDYGDGDFGLWIRWLVVAVVAGILVRVAQVVRGDASALPEARRERLRALLKKRIEGFAGVYPVLPILLAATGALGLAVFAEDWFSGERSMKPTLAIVMSAVFFAQSGLFINEHRVEIPWCREQLARLAGALPPGAPERLPA